MKLLVLILGAVFGLALSRGGATDYNYIQNMFLFRSFQLYGIMATAVVLIAPGLFLLKRFRKTYSGEPLRVPTKLQHRGNIWGGILFGIGWSITGMCPGPIFVNIGEGKWYALAAAAGALLGTYGFGRLYPRLRVILRLPPIETGTGSG